MSLDYFTEKIAVISKLKTANKEFKERWKSCRDMFFKTHLYSCMLPVEGRKIIILFQDYL